MRLDCNRQDICQRELAVFMDWLRSLRLDPVFVRATAIEARDGDPPGWYRLHITQYARDGDGAMELDLATAQPKLEYRVVHFHGWTWPFVRAAERT